MSMQPPRQHNFSFFSNLLEMHLFLLGNSQAPAILLPIFMAPVSPGNSLEFVFL